MKIHPQRIMRIWMMPSINKNLFNKKAKLLQSISKSRVFWGVKRRDWYQRRLLIPRIERNRDILRLYKR